VSKGISTGVFGDIDFMPHLEWIQMVCKQAGTIPILPLWGGHQDKIVNEFIEQGFKAQVIATRADLLGSEWLGRIIDRQFLKDVVSYNKDITPCGEAGEFHTLVVDGPIFKKCLEISDTAPARRGEHWFWDIKKIKLLEKVQGKTR
jgi:diphthine-ammonia ligase